MAQGVGEINARAQSRASRADVRVQHLVEADDIGLHLAEQGTESVQAVSVISVPKRMNIEGDNPQPERRLDAERVHSGEQDKRHCATHRSTTAAKIAVWKDVRKEPSSTPLSALWLAVRRRPP